MSSVPSQPFVRSKYFKYSDESHKMILSKSNENKDVFDVINFVSKGCTELKIPPNIKIIMEDSFARCHINKIYIPKSVTHIQSHAFCDCHASSIVFEEDSDIQLIDHGVFASKFINYFKLPRKIKYLNLCAFNDSKKLKFIELLSEDVYLYDESDQYSNIPNPSYFFISFPNASKIKVDDTLTNSVFFTLPNIELTLINK